MRAALGASRGRIARVLLSESVLLALAGGAARPVARAGGHRPAARRSRRRSCRASTTSASTRLVLLFTLSISVLSGALFGLLAVVRFGKPSITALKEGGRSASDAPGRHRTRNALVVGQVALALTLLIVSGLMIRTFVAMRQVDPGFTRPGRGADVRARDSGEPHQRSAAGGAHVREHRRTAGSRCRASPPSVSRRRSRWTAKTTATTLRSRNSRSGRDDADAPALQEHRARYFETMGNRLVAGRSITWTDIYERRPVVVISETLAREYWGEPAKAIGKRVRGSSRGFRGARSSACPATSATMA